MLKKVFRGLNRIDFQKSLTEGKLIQSPLFAISVIKSEEDKNQFGFIVSKKISKLAVSRNRIKRLLSESVRENIKNWGEQKYKIIFLARRSLLEKKFGEVEAEVRRVLKNLNETNNP